MNLAELLKRGSAPKVKPENVLRKNFRRLKKRCAGNTAYSSLLEELGPESQWRVRDFAIANFRLEQLLEFPLPPCGPELSLAPFEAILDDDDHEQLLTQVEAWIQMENSAFEKRIKKILT